jgi:hypothetical protein
VTAIPVSATFASPAAAKWGATIFWKQISSGEAPRFDAHKKCAEFSLRLLFKIEEEGQSVNIKGAELYDTFLRGLSQNFDLSKPPDCLSSLSSKEKRKQAEGANGLAACEQPCAIPL